MVTENWSTYSVFADQALLKGGIFPKDIRLSARHHPILEELRQKEDFVLFDRSDHVFDCRTVALFTTSLICG